MEENKPEPNQFLIERWGKTPRCTIAIGREAELSEVLEAFEIFLLSCGYAAPENTMLDFVPKDNH